LQDLLEASATEEKRKKRTASAPPQESHDSMAAREVQNKPAPAARTMKSVPSRPLKIESEYVQKKLDSQILGSLSSQLPPLEKFKQDVLTFCRQQEGTGHGGDDFKQLQVQGKNILQLSLTLAEKHEQFIEDMVVFDEYINKDKRDFCNNAARIFDL
jgi:hypothetical protein